MLGIIIVFIIIAIKNNLVHTVNIIVMIHIIIFQVESLSYMPALRITLELFVLIP